MQPFIAYRLVDKPYHRMLVALITLFSEMICQQYKNNSSKLDYKIKNRIDRVRVIRSRGRCSQGTNKSVRGQAAQHEPLADTLINNIVDGCPRRTRLI